MTGGLDSNTDGDKGKVQNNRGGLTKKIRQAAGANIEPVLIVDNPKEKTKALQELRIANCASTTKALNLSPVNGQDVRELLEKNPPLARACGLDFIKVHQNEPVVSVRVGKKHEDCGVVYDQSLVRKMSRHIFTAESHRTAFMAFAAYHDGAHCHPSNYKEKMLTEVDYENLSLEELGSLGRYREANSDSVALLMQARDYAQAGQFAEFKDYLAVAYDKFAKGQEIVVDGVSLKNPPTRQGVFYSYLRYFDYLDSQKISSLSDDKLREVARGIGEAGSSWSLNGDPYKFDQTFAGKFKEIVKSSRS